ncbi:MAG: hypothetical protein R2828_03570 [Saprospiraceae bacterium]
MDTVDQKFIDLETGSFIPMALFIEMMGEISQLPYQTTFSFEPFLNTLKKSVVNDGSHTAEVAKMALVELEKDLTGADCHIKNEAFTTKLDSIMGLVMPSLMFRDNRSMITPPFVKRFAYKTPAMKAFFMSGDWEVKVMDKGFHYGIGNNTIQAAIFILNKFYGADFPLFDGTVITFRNRHNGLEKHFQMSIRFDFIEVEALNPLKKISKKQIDELYYNLHDEALWLKTVSPEDFAFSGLAIGTFHDVTEIEIISQLKGLVMDREQKMNPVSFMPYLKGQLQSYLNLPELEFGFVGVVFQDFLGNTSFSLTGLNKLAVLTSYEDGEAAGGVYYKASVNDNPLLFHQLTEIKRPSIGEKRLLEKGINSLILIPMKDNKGKLISIFEIASTATRGFNSLTMLKLRELFDLLRLGNDQYFQDMNNRISQFIKQQFTSIHPSVEWRFEQVAADHEVRKTLVDFDGSISPIVFKDVYPLYGQADIVSSSNLRNRFIQLDLIENLERASRLMQIWLKHLDFHLLESFYLEVETILDRLRATFMSSDESQVVDLLTKEIHPLLRQLKEQYTQLPEEPYWDYMNGLDDTLDVVYDQRKKYEDSVSRLNQAVGSYLEKDDEKMQKILPHFFEKYKTDGVEYNIYIGQSLLQAGTFSDFFLKDFRLWQLVNMSEITRLVVRQSRELPVPLTTAQLVFVYNSPLSIRFRMDEKQFDVDGTYNVRYEILKKRIDKAVVKETGERLTQAGKIAIVYLQEKDRQEYLGYLEYLIRKGYITEEIEQLDLEKMQGADGLKALRVTVVVPKA